jgi:hypothetical protein
MKRFILVFILLAYFVALNPMCLDAQLMSLKGIGYLAGFGKADLAENKGYELIPFMVDLDFDIKPLTERIGFAPPSLVQFQIEPFLSLVASPDTNMEVGTSFLLKFGLVPEGWKFQPYVKCGTGVIWMSQHVSEQTTQFNFISSFGAGFHYFFTEDRALSLEYRFRHASNAGIKHPNGGIDNQFGLLGITHIF